jgi:hypothetical protein
MMVEISNGVWKKLTDLSPNDVAHKLIAMGLALSDLENPDEHLDNVHEAGTELVSKWYYENAKACLPKEPRI